MSNFDVIALISGGTVIIIGMIAILIMVVDCFRYVRELQRREKEDEEFLEETSFHETDEPMEIEVETDGSEYENRILEYIRSLGISIYYSNYSQTSVEVTGSHFSTGCVKIDKNNPIDQFVTVDQRTIEEWSELCDVAELEPGICYAFRVSYKGENFLVWGKNREDAYLNLFGLAVNLDLNYA